ncbi:MAG: S-layer homology domain-containing protein [Candidatus Riflebacteria bacterium]|nr:S-layer homology domain-containing protein [Candidatus Riflebacteria bacterium]
MRQNIARGWAFSVPMWAVIALFISFLMPLRAQQIISTSSPTFFQDLPKNHWAFNDINFLIGHGYMTGYPDNSFQGRRVITRYDIALILARILHKTEEKGKDIDEATETERAALSRLTREFKDELGLLGVRVDSLERRMSDSQNRLNTLENAKPNVKVSGIYRTYGQFTIDPISVNRDIYGDKQLSLSKPGMSLFKQQFTLQFTGKPLGDQIEAFYELQGVIQGKTYQKLIYNDTGKIAPNPFDRIDDYITKIQSDRWVESYRAHFISNAKSLKTRIFANESINGINDPLNMITEDSDVVYPYMGAEISGASKGVSYQSCIYKGDTLKIGHIDVDSDEMIGGRMVWKLPSKFTSDAISIGTSYAEKIYDYKTRGNSNTVRGVDVNYTTERVGKTQATIEFLSSTDYHADTSDKNTMKNMGAPGAKFDASIQNGGFTGTFKYYDFGKDFRAKMAPIWAFDIGEEDEDGGDGYPNDPRYSKNYGHNGFYGEKLSRFGANYDFGNKLLSIAKNLSMEATYLSKTWEVDPFAPQITDGYSGHKFTYHLVSDFTDNTKLTYDFEQKLDALAKESGAIKNIFELDMKLSDSVSSKGKISLLNDRDGDGKLFDGKILERNDRTGYFEITANINPRVFTKGSVEHQVRWLSTPDSDTRIDYKSETTYNLTPTTNLIGGIQHVDYEMPDNPDKSSLANAILAELKKNFTKRFRGRAFYTRGIVDYKNGKTNSRDYENIYGEMIYDISKDANLKLRFGYDYPDDRWGVTDSDNGRDNKTVKTQKTLYLEAKATF